MHLPGLAGKDAVTRGSVIQEDKDKYSDIRNDLKPCMVIDAEGHRPAAVDGEQEEGEPGDIDEPQDEQPSCDPGNFFPKTTRICHHEGGPEAVHTVANAAHGDNDRTAAIDAKDKPGLRMGMDVKE